MAVQTRLDECLSICDGRSFVEEYDADELARRFGTPGIKRPETVADVFMRDLVPLRLRRPR